MSWEGHSYAPEVMLWGYERVTMGYGRVMMGYERVTMGLRICTNHFQGGYESVRKYYIYHYCQTASSMR